MATYNGEDKRLLRLYNDEDNAVIDVQVDGSSVVSDGIASINLSDKQDLLIPGTNVSISDNVISATDTTYSPFVGATSLADGTSGLVPVPTVADKDNFLRGDGTWAAGGGGGASALSDLTDTNLSSPTDGEVLKYDGVTSKWVNAAESGGSGNVDDVMVNGSSVVDSNHVAQITSYVELTQSEYDALPNSKLSDGVLYCIKDDGAVDGSQFAPLIFSLQEREIGTWSDGKPLYVKTIRQSNIMVGYDSDVHTQIAHGVSNVGEVVGLQICCPFLGIAGKDILFSGNSPLATFRVDGTYVYAVAGNNHFGATADRVWYFTIWYTKSTDNPGSGSWGTNGVPMEHYDDSEQVIGTWFGETLYKKSVNFGAFPNATSKSVAHNISNLKFCVDLIASGSDSNGNMLVLPRVVNDSSVFTAQASCYITATNVVIEAGTDRSSYSGYVTIKYTKSS